MPDPSPGRIRSGIVPWAGALFFFSGAAGLVYEVLWFRLLLLKLGGTGMSVATVTAAFMTGLGLGAWLFGTRLGLRVPPLRLYGVLEAFIGVYALAVPWLIRVAGGVDAAILGSEPGAMGRVARFLIAGVVLVPPTLCMGGTLPVLSRLIEGGTRRPGRFVGLLYGLNTTGAVAGAAATGFFLMPALGLDATIGLAAAVNLLLAAAALLLSRGDERVPDERAPQPEAASTRLDEEPRPGLAIMAAFASGLASFVLQVSWTRILALTFGSSVYAFSLILVLFLLGLGAGALAGAWASARVARPGRGLAWCFVGVGATVLAGEAGYAYLPKLYLEAIVAAGGRASLGGAAWMAAAIMVPPTLLLGAAFPFAVRLATGDRSANAAAGVGRLYAGNTAGGVLGAYLAALVLIPALGLSGAVTLAAFLVLAVAAALGLVSAGPVTASAVRRSAPAAVALASVAAWAALVPAWDRNLMSMGVSLWGPHAVAHGRDVARDLASLSSDRVLFYRDGVTATVAVKEAGPVARVPGAHRLADAVAAWDRAAAAAPAETIVPAWRGVARLGLGDAVGAHRDFRAARALAGGAPVPIPLDLYEAWALQDLGRDAEARPFLERFVGGLPAGEDASPEGAAALERLALVLRNTCAEPSRATDLADRAAVLRGRLGRGILGEAVRISDETGDAAARAYLRDLSGMDPALRAELARAAPALPAIVRGRALALLAGIPGR